MVEAASVASVAPAKKKRAKFPVHDRIIRSFRFAMRVDPKREPGLHAALDGTHALRNDLVAFLNEERALNRERKARGEKREWSSRNSLQSWTAEWSKRTGIHLHAHVRHNVVDRVLEGIERWLEALKEGRKGVKPPGPIDRRKHRSFTFKEYGNGCRISNGKAFLSGLGWFKLFDHRRIIGQPKTLTVKFAEGRWWCVVTSAIFEDEWFGPETDHEGKPDAGGDPGLTHLMSDSHGRVFDPPRRLKESQGKLRRAQRVLSRKFVARKDDYAKARALSPMPAELPPLREMPLSNRLLDQIKTVAKLHTKVGRQRDNDQKKIAAVVSDLYGRFGCEEHGVMFMIRNRKLAKSASDRAIGSQKHHLASALGKRYVPTPNARPGIGGNSQTCLCGARVEKALSERMHDCPACGLKAPRDFVSANLVQTIAFGTVSPAMETLVAARTPPQGETAPGAAEDGVPAGGQPVVTRGGPEGEEGESVRSEPTTALEAPLKREPPKSQPNEAPRVGNLPWKARPAGIDRRLPPRRTLPHEPEPEGQNRATAASFTLEGNP